MDTRGSFSGGREAGA